MSKLDQRRIFTADARFSVVQTEGKPTMLRGYALVWNVPSSDRGGYKVRLKPGSAKFTPNVHALYHHEFHAVLGDTESGTLRVLPPDDYGVPVEIDLPDTSLGRDVAELVRTRRVRGMSFAMVDEPRGTTVTENGQKILDVDNFEVDEVTVTAIPAFMEAVVGVATPTAPTLVMPVYADRTAHSLRLEQFRFSSFRLPGATSPSRAV